MRALQVQLEDRIRYKLHNDLKYFVNGYLLILSGVEISTVQLLLDRATR